MSMHRNRNTTQVVALWQVQGVVCPVLLRDTGLLAHEL